MKGKVVGLPSKPLITCYLFGFLYVLITELSFPTNPLKTKIGILL